MHSTRSICDRMNQPPSAEDSKKEGIDRMSRYRTRLRIFPTEFPNFVRSSGCMGGIHYVELVDTYNVVSRAIKSNGGGRVLIIDNFMRNDCSCLSPEEFQTAQSNGWAGIIVRGAVRNTAEFARLPAQKSALRATMSHPQWWFPLEKDQLTNWRSAFPFTSFPDDWVFADDDGVLFVRKNFLMQHKIELH
ncbi:MAG: hypothetical protein K2X57_28810 [Xanthobacteraceae bacterium]|nr:hypothetical protein [Xanthobacteraceae bacterium]